MSDTRPVLVTGATGRQGGGTARALLSAGASVRALVRDPSAQAAKDLEAAGASLVRGNLRDKDGLVEACQGVRGVFSVQTPLDGMTLSFESEREQGRFLVEAALEADVPQFVHTSASGVGAFHRAAPGWDEGRWNVVEYFESKAAAQELVAASGFEFWTLVKPPTFMDHNFFERASFVDGRLLTAIAADTRLPLVAPVDIGKAAAAAFLDPARFHEVELELAGDLLTIGEITAILGETWGEELATEIVSPDEAVTRGMPAPVAEAQEWFNVVGSPARPEQARSLGLDPIDFRTWATQTYS